MVVSLFRSLEVGVKSFFWLGLGKAIMKVLYMEIYIYNSFNREKLYLFLMSGNPGSLMGSIPKAYNRPIVSIFLESF